MAEKDFLNPDESMNLQTSEGDNLVLNLEDVDESAPSFEALPPGVYDCVVENTDFGPSQRSNRPMITWVFKVVDPQYEGRLLFNHTVIDDTRGQQRLKQILTRVLPDIDLKQFNPTRFCDEGTAIGYPCRVKVNVRPYQGQKRNNVQDVLPPAEGGNFLDE